MQLNLGAWRLISHLKGNPCESEAQTKLHKAKQQKKVEGQLHSVPINPWRETHTNFSISFSTPALLSMPGWVAELFCVVSREAQDRGSVWTSRPRNAACAGTPGQRTTEVEMTLNVLDQVHKRQQIIRKKMKERSSREEKKMNDEMRRSKNWFGIWQHNNMPNCAFVLKLQSPEDSNLA